MSYEKCRRLSPIVRGIQPRKSEFREAAAINELLDHSHHLLWRY